MYDQLKKSQYIQVYISQCLFKYYTGKWLKFEILKYNQVPIFFPSIFKYFPVFPV